MSTVSNPTLSHVFPPIPFLSCSFLPTINDNAFKQRLMVWVISCWVLMQRLHRWLQLNSASFVAFGVLSVDCHRQWAFLWYTLCETFCGLVFGYKTAFLKMSNQYCYCSSNAFNEKHKDSSSSFFCMSLVKELIHLSFPSIVFIQNGLTTICIYLATLSLSFFINQLHRKPSSAGEHNRNWSWELQRAEEPVSNTFLTTWTTYCTTKTNVQQLVLQTNIL